MNVTAELLDGDLQNMFDDNDLMAATGDIFNLPDMPLQDEVPNIDQAEDDPLNVVAPLDVVVAPLDVVVAPLDVVVAPLDVVVAPLDVVVAPLDVVVAPLDVENHSDDSHVEVNSGTSGDDMDTDDSDHDEGYVDTSLIMPRDTVQDLGCCTTFQAMNRELVNVAVVGGKLKLKYTIVSFQPMLTLVSSKTSMIRSTRLHTMGGDEYEQTVYLVNIMEVMGMTDKGAQLTDLLADNDDDADTNETWLLNDDEELAIAQFWHDAMSHETAQFAIELKTIMIDMLKTPSNKNIWMASCTVLLRRIQDRFVRVVNEQSVIVAVQAKEVEVITDEANAAMTQLADEQDAYHRLMAELLVTRAALASANASVAAGQAQAPGVAAAAVEAINVKLALDQAIHENTRLNERLDTIVQGTCQAVKEIVDGKSKQQVLIFKLPLLLAGITRPRYCPSRWKISLALGLHPDKHPSRATDENYRSLCAARDDFVKLHDMVMK